MTMNVVNQIDNMIAVRNVLISVSDKSSLKQLVSGLLEINPKVMLYSTGGTYNAIRDFLGSQAGTCLKQVSDYTGQQETQGGLVKTLDFKIYLSILTETYNGSHQQDLAKTGAVPFDMVVVNLYPFKETIAKPDVTVEHARGNIDIGGPCMIRASAKNFIRVASVVDPGDYVSILSEMKAGNGRIPLELRFKLAQKAYSHTAAYDQMIAQYLNSRTYENVKACYPTIQ
jgi:phosphoribosylaminoimidazolecarboxamide formyltransferase / IMP cyclohydrolase